MGLQSKVEANSRWKPGRVLRCVDCRCLKGPMGPSSPQPPEPRMLARYGILGLVESRPRQRVIVAKSAFYLLIPIVGGRGPPRPSPGARRTPRNNISPQCAARRGNDGRFSCQVAKPGRARAVLDAVYSGSRARHSAQTRGSPICYYRYRRPERLGMHQLGLWSGGTVSAGIRFRRRGSIHLQEPR